MVSPARRGPPVVLTIAGTDSGGGAGIAADLATYAALGVHGAAVVTAVTAQDTTGVHAVHAVPLAVVEAQVDAVLGDLAPAVVKTGMLASAAVARLVAARCAAGPSRPLVVDPVLRATTGASLAGEDLVLAYRDHLLPVATVVTPNAAEARILLGLGEADTTPAHELAELLAEKLSGPAVLLTGGPTVTAPPPGGPTVTAPHQGGPTVTAPHQGGPTATAPHPGVLGVGTDRASAGPEIRTNTDQTRTATPPDGPPPPPAQTCTDWLARPGRVPVALTHPAISTSNDHGTGCTHASALAAHLARGDDLETAAARAAAYVKCKINANIGNSAVTSNVEDELEKLHTAVHLGADTVMDLSTGGDIDGIRQAIIAPRRCRSAPCRSTRRSSRSRRQYRGPDRRSMLLDMVEHQAKQGVDYMTVHAGVLLRAPAADDAAASPASSAAAAR
jgi:hydroxymethylpyrimidine/phosphomethylpyrimidine kinase